MTINVTIWNEYRHEKVHEEARKVYPDGLHAPIAEHLRAEGMSVRVATLDEPEHGLTEDVLAGTDVLTWWGHMAHHEVSDEIAARVQQRVLLAEAVVEVAGRGAHVLVLAVRVGGDSR